MKLPDPLQALADHVRPALSTTPDDVLPDIGPGMGQARDDGLDALAEQTTSVVSLPDAGAGETESEQRTAASLDTSIGEARAQHLDFAHVPHDPLADVRAMTERL